MPVAAIELYALLQSWSGSGRYLPWISSSISLDPSMPVSVDICVGFQAWLVSTNFELYLPWFSSSIDNLSWFSSSVDPIPLRVVSVGIDLGFQAVSVGIGLGFQA
ncbi:hypothetical protein NC651_000141 [Populus alba x Populus x berolinensis]|nr:hypothetical protein NC651_000141 [Populus alba x Populus x berolinensis]